jgi:hypothetical protein
LKESIDDKRKFDQIMLEKDLLIHMDHPFLVKLSATFESNRHINFLIDFYPGGELFFHIQRVRIS